MALPANVANAINAVCLKLNQRDPGASATANNVKLTAALTDWPKGTKEIGWGAGPWTTVKATLFCNGMANLGIDATSVQTLRTFFGI